MDQPEIKLNPDDFYTLVVCPDKKVAWSFVEEVCCANECSDADAVRTSSISNAAFKEVLLTNISFELFLVQVGNLYRKRGTYNNSVSRSVYYSCLWPLHLFTQFQKVFLEFYKI